MALADPARHLGATFTMHSKACFARNLADCADQLNAPLKTGRVRRLYFFKTARKFNKKHGEQKNMTLADSARILEPTDGRLLIS